MESLLFLLLMLGVIALGTTVVLLRAREPKGEYRGIKSFQREMRALAPEGPRGLGNDGTERPPGLDPLLPDTAVPTPSNDEIRPQPAESQE
jgi:hypothetical protein